MNTHVVYFDVLRVLSIYAVIILHVAGHLFLNNPPHSFTWETANLYNGLMRWCVPVFVMISGALFLNPEKKISLHQLFSKNISHLAVLLLFWTVFYAVLNLLLIPSQRTLPKLLENIVLGDYHLWFLYMLLGLYILIPLLRPLFQKTESILYFLTISFIFCFLPSFIFMVLIGLNLAFPNVVFSEIFRIGKILLNQKINLHFTLGYTSYFILGYYIHQTVLSKKLQKAIYLLGIAGCIFPILFTQYVSQKALLIFDFYTDSNNSLPILFTSLAIFVFVKQHTHIKSEKLIAFFRYASKRTLGIYLAHVAILKIFSDFLFFFHTHLTPLISIPLISLIVWVFSLLLTEILCRIPFINKYIL